MKALPRFMLWLSEVTHAVAPRFIGPCHRLLQRVSPKTLPQHNTVTFHDVPVPCIFDLTPAHKPHPPVTFTQPFVSSADLEGMGIVDMMEKGWIVSPSCSGKSMMGLHIAMAAMSKGLQVITPHPQFSMEGVFAKMPPAQPMLVREIGPDGTKTGAHVDLNEGAEGSVIDLPSAPIENLLDTPKDNITNDT